MESTRKHPKRLPAWHPKEPCNALPLLPPKADLETKAILKQCIRARAALAELKQAGEIVYTPPVGEDLLRSLLANWERFLHDVTQTDEWDAWVLATVSRM